MAQRRRRAIPFQRFAGIALHALPTRIKYGDVVMRDGVTLLRRETIPFVRFGKILFYAVPC